MINERTKTVYRCMLFVRHAFPLSQDPPFLANNGNNNSVNLEYHSRVLDSKLNADHLGGVTKTENFLSIFITASPFHLACLRPQREIRREKSNDQN